MEELEHQKTIYTVLKKYGLYNKREEYIDVCYIGYAKALKKYDSEKSSLNTFIYTCVDNELKNFLRHENCSKRQREEVNIDLSNIASEEEPLHEKMIVDESISEMLNALKELTAEEEFVIKNLYKLNDRNLTNQELALTLNVSKSRVSNIKNKALRKLKKQLGDEHNEHTTV